MVVGCLSSFAAVKSLPAFVVYISVPCSFFIRDSGPLMLFVLIPPIFDSSIVEFWQLSEVSLVSAPSLGPVSFLAYGECFWHFTAWRPSS
jgi:hypothetical protein